MKLIIDIDEEIKAVIDKKGTNEIVAETLWQSAKNGIPLDDLRAEIESLIYYWCEVHPKSVIDDVLQIIDKYRNDEQERSE